MRVNIDRSARLPRQAWVLHARDGIVDALAGEGVRLADDSFFEGGWALTEGPESLRPAGVHLGSGAVWRSGRLTLIAPSHTLECIWTAEAPGRLWASNSLACLIGATRPAGFAIWPLRHVIRTIHDGVVRYSREIFQEDGLTIRRFANAFVRIEAGRLVEEQQRQEAPFDSYASYVAFLTGTVAEAIANHGGPASVYLSRGYDSPAVAALAARLGPVTAICIDRTATGSDDGGTMIAEALGIPFVPIERKPRPTRIVTGKGWSLPLETINPEDYAEVFEFYCGVHISEESMRTPDEVVAGRAILTGWAGDAMWGISGNVWRDFVRPIRNSGGIGLVEFRLRTGFTHLPVPSLSFNHADIVRAIGLSDEMAPWRLGSAYDRPIPRRIAEEAGVPRHLFGQAKQYTATKAVLRDIAPILFDMQVARYAPALEPWPFTRAPAMTQA